MRCKHLGSDKLNKKCDICIIALTLKLQKYYLGKTIREYSIYKHK